MPEFVCKVGDFKELLQVISLKGKDLKGKEYTAIPDFLLSVEPDGLKVKAMDNKGSLAVNLHYKAVKVSQAGVMAIDSEILQGYLDRYNATDEVTVSAQENRIIIIRNNPQKVSRIPLSDESLVTSQGVDVFQNFVKSPSGYYQSKKTNWNVALTLKAEDVKDVVDDGEVVKQRIYPWKLENGALSIKVGAQPQGEIETIVSIIKAETETPFQPSTKTSFAYGLDNIFGNLVGEVKVYLGNNMESCPLILEKTSDKYSLVVFLAPAVIVE